MSRRFLYSTSVCFIYLPWTSRHSPGQYVQISWYWLFILSLLPVAHKLRDCIRCNLPANQRLSLQKLHLHYSANTRTFCSTTQIFIDKNLSQASPPLQFPTSGDLYEKCNVLRGKACACLCLPSWFLPHLAWQLQYKTCQGAWEFYSFHICMNALTYVLYFDLRSYKCV